MSRLPCSNALGLERSMNQQVRVMTFVEHLRHAKLIDELDDIRRTKAHGLTKWFNDMNISFNKKMIKALKEDDKEKMVELLDEIKVFNESYLKLRKKHDKDELYYEEMDDELRDWLLEYACKCREELKIENSAIEKKLIQENLHKKELNKNGKINSKETKGE